MEQIFKRAIEQNEESEPAETEGFFCYTIEDPEVSDLAAFSNFYSVLEDHDDDGDNFSSKMTRLYGYVDFEDCELIDPEVGLERYSSDIQELDHKNLEEDHKEGQPIFKPHFCIGPFHWAVALHKDSSLPQVLSGDLLESIFLLNDVLVDHNPVIGFNSLLAGALENKLHVECIIGTAHPDFRPVLLSGLQMEVLLSSSLKRKEISEDDAVITDELGLRWSNHFDKEN